MLSDNIGRTPEGVLTIAGQEVTRLAAEYGTPLYLMDEQRIRSNCRMYLKAFRENFPEGSLPLYASKAASFKQIYRIMAEEGMGYVLTLENLVNTQGTPLCFRRMEPVAEVQLSLVWKKYQTQSRAASAFISALEEAIGSRS